MLGAEHLLANRQRTLMERPRPRTRLFSTASGRRRQPSYIKVRERIAALRYPATAIDLT
jgi:hypothetical protein